MSDSEKNFLEKIADLIPGVKGYRDKEARRDTDKSLREELARRIDASRTDLERVKRGLLDKGQLDQLGHADRVGGKMQKAADGLRYASYGYAGFFDQVKIREDELDRLYEYDRGLAVRVEELSANMEGIPAAGDAGEALGVFEDLVDSLLADIDNRKALFDTTE